MHKTTDYADAFSSADIDSAHLKEFAETLSRFEVETGFKPRKVLVNGIPSFPDVLTAHFEVPKAQTIDVIGKLLGHSRFTPDIIINGKPAFKNRRITVSTHG